jgi:hypothetical protein
MSDEKTDPKRLPRNVWILTTTSFLTDISSEMIFNLVPSLPKFHPWANWRPAVNR